MSKTVKFKFEFDQRIKHRLNAFEGFIEARCQFRNGCVQYQVEPAVLKDGVPMTSIWLDEQDIEVVKPAPKVKGSAGRSGGPQDHPPACAGPVGIGHT